MSVQTVGIAGQGAIGLALAQALDRGVEGSAADGMVSARDTVRAPRPRSRGFAHPPRGGGHWRRWRSADIVVEATPATVFDDGGPARHRRGPHPCGLLRRRALLPRMALIDEARRPRRPHRRYRPGRCSGSMPSVPRRRGRSASVSRSRRVSRPTGWRARPTSCSTAFRGCGAEWRRSFACSRGTRSTRRPGSRRT